MINGSNIRLPNGQFSTLVTPVNKDGVTQLITPVDANGNVITGGGSSDPSQITSETAPTTRVNPSTGLPSGGAALQIGDRWYKPSNGQEGFWNGTLWLSTTVYTNVWAVLTATISGNGASMTTPVFGGADASIWFEKFVVNGTFASPQDGSNYRTFAVFANTGSSTILATANSIGLTNRAKIIQPINVAAPTHGIGLSVGFVGSPGTITSFGMTVFYREIFS